MFDPRNHIENALQASRQLDSLANEARMLANQARELAAFDGVDSFQLSHARN